VRGKEEWSHVKGVIDCIFAEHGHLAPPKASLGGSMGGGLPVIESADASKGGWDVIVTEGEGGSWSFEPR